MLLTNILDSKIGTITRNMIHKKLADCGKKVNILSCRRARSYEKPNILSKSSSPVAIVIVFNMPLSKLKNDDSYYKHYVGSKSHSYVILGQTMNL